MTPTGGLVNWEKGRDRDTRRNQEAASGPTGRRWAGLRGFCVSAGAYCQPQEEGRDEESSNVANCSTGSDREILNLASSAWVIFGPCSSEGKY